MTESSTEHRIPAIHLFHLARLAERLGVPERVLVAELPFPAKDMADPFLNVPLPVAVALFERARALTGEPGIGVLLGMQTYGSEHGYLGFATLTATTVREAIELMVKYAPIRSTAFAFELEVAGSRAALVVEERADFGSARDIVVLGLLVGLRRTAALRLGREWESTMIEAMLPEPEYYRRFRHVRPPIRFGRPKHRIVFDASILDLPLTTGDPASHRLAREQCERLLDSISTRSQLVDQVARMVLRSGGGLRSFEEVADALGMSSRTLRRRLAELRTTFSDVRDRELRDRATDLLRSSDLPVTRIAGRLGYANHANFLRAFRQWTGQSPTEYRASARSK